MNRLQAQPKHPFRDILQAVTGVKPPKFVRGYSTRGYTDAEKDELQSWASDNVKPSWATGIGLIEAAENMVEEAEINGNIPHDPDAPKKAKKATRRRTKKAPSKASKFVTVEGDFLGIDVRRGRIRIGWQTEEDGFGHYLGEPNGAKDPMITIAEKAVKPFAEEGMEFEDITKANKALKAAEKALLAAYPKGG